MTVAYTEIRRLAIQLLAAKMLNNKFIHNIEMQVTYFCQN